MKIINKGTIKQAFRNNDTFQELEIMQELTRHNCPKMLQLIESFEDDEAYYAVT